MGVSNQLDYEFVAPNAFYIPSGNLFMWPSEAIVVPVNTKGVMGAGLALQVRKRFPKTCKEYQDYCKEAGMPPGQAIICAVHKEEQYGSLNYLIFLTTKDHWVDPSKIGYVHDGLIELDYLLRDHCVESVSIPQLGCGLGHLEWENVQPLIQDLLCDNTPATCYVFGERK